MKIETIAAALRRDGYVAIEQWLPAGMLISLGHSCDNSQQSGFVSARVGRDHDRLPNESVRGDVTRWLDDTRQVDHAFLHLMDELRLSLNAALFLGLFDYECHYAVYECGTGYQKHLDSLQGGGIRLLSTVLYLDENWTRADGGALILYAHDGAEIVRIQPRAGLLVLFLSEQFPHEVQVTHRKRHSIAGWFQGRASG